MPHPLPAAKRCPCAACAARVPEKIVPVPTCCINDPVANLLTGRGAADGSPVTAAKRTLLTGLGAELGTAVLAETAAARRGGVGALLETALGRGASPPEVKNPTAAAVGLNPLVTKLFAAPKRRLWTKCRWSLGRSKVKGVWAAADRPRTTCRSTRPPSSIT